MMTVLVALAATLLTSCAAPIGEGSPSQSAGFPSTEESSGSSSEAPAGAESEFETDFSQHSVPYSEILSGGPPKDGIPPIDDPQFIEVGEADEWLEPEEPVILFQVGDDVRAYPIQIIIWHEIVNDTVGGEPVVVTFCPLCNTSIAFDRTLNGREFTFGTTGRLRFSNLIMYDRQTETWWQQATGEAIVGELTGEQLNFRSASIISWEEFKSAHPDGKVLSRNTDNPRNYGQNPYPGYDDADSSPFLYEGPDTPGELPPKARVITVDSENEAVAYPYDVLQEQRVVNDEVDGKPVAVFWSPDTASALDEGQVEEGRDVGSAGVFSRKLDGRTLTFRYEGDRIVDEQTGSEWTPLGEAVGGELEGKKLERVTSVEHFWFSWAAFKPDTRVYGSEGG